MTELPENDDEYQECDLLCPHCWQRVEFFEEASALEQEGSITQDCDRCCHPLVLVIADGKVVEVRSELRG